ncbi:MAG TPA: large-conductance mechanosensitive channel protein MscL [Verrucomicrobiae bacterium]|nr:large-conductance mechanosensitive channel protein MscL [Verrucomicrobiae bacterium]
MLKEFKEFAFRGNLIDMAVGIIIGGAFGTVVKSLVDNIFMPPLGAITAGIDFSKLSLTLQEAKTETVDGKEVITPEVALNYGQFINDFIAFVILAFVVFIVIKKFLGALKKEKELAPAAPPKQELLLEEIRDLLAKKA